MRIVIQIAMLAMLSASCEKPKTAPKAWSFADSVGLVVLKDGRACLSIHNSSLPADTGVRIVTTSALQAEFDAHIVKADASCPNTNNGAQSYEVGGATGLADPMPAIAIVGFRGKFNRRGDLITADLDGDAQDEFFRSCTSTEGIHFTVWSGGPHGKLRWHEYYYLGYDVSPTCTDKETESPK